MTTPSQQGISICCTNSLPTKTYHFWNVKTERCLNVFTIASEDETFLAETLEMCVEWVGWRQCHHWFIVSLEFKEVCLSQDLVYLTNTVNCDVCVMIQCSWEERVGVPRNLFSVSDDVPHPCLGPLDLSLNVCLCVCLCVCVYVSWSELLLGSSLWR